MKKAILAILSLTLCVAAAAQNSKVMRSIQDFGVFPSNGPQLNKVNLQKAIDWASASGAALYVTPAENGYKVATGIRLKENVSLIGAHGPTGRGTLNEAKDGPTGSLFVITDEEEPFISCESATQIRGIQFYYPEQELNDPSKLKKYKPTITMAKDVKVVEGVTLSCLTFYGEWEAMNFVSGEGQFCEQILFEHCYGFPLSGKFISIDRCYDIPRILHCHVNPANMREFKRFLSGEVVKSIGELKTYTYWIDHTDNAVLVDLFTFGVYGGIYLGPSTYGQLTSFNLDCVCVGIFKDGDSFFNRDWAISQGSIIANWGDSQENIHPFVVRGKGFTAITDVIAFSGKNGAVPAIGTSQDFISVEGEEKLALVIQGCRMANYVAENPITVKNPNASISVTNCINKDWGFFEFAQNK